MKTLYLLIGPKGSGKTFIGTIVDEYTDICFLRVEPIWLALKTDEDGWQKVEEAIAQQFTNHDRVMIENLGAGEGFKRFLRVIQDKYRIKLIQIRADLDLCFKRVKERSNENHIPVSDDKILRYNAIAARTILNWDLVIENDGRQPVSSILEKIRTI